MQFNIRKIVTRRTFCDYVIEGIHPKLGKVVKVVSVVGHNEKMAIAHLEERFLSEGTPDKIEEGYHPTGHFPGNNDYWGWAASISAWFSPNDIIAKRQVNF